MEDQRRIYAFRNGDGGNRLAAEEILPPFCVSVTLWRESAAGRKQGRKGASSRFRECPCNPVRLKERILQLIQRKELYERKLSLSYHHLPYRGSSNLAACRDQMTPEAASPRIRGRSRGAQGNRRKVRPSRNLRSMRR